MGADLLISALVIERDRQPDFAAARAAADSLRSDQVETPDEFWDDDSTTDEGLAAIRSQLSDSLIELESAFRQSRELALMQIRGATVYLTGGMSWGDAPTDLFETFTRLWAAPTVLAAAGFEVAP